MATNKWVIRTRDFFMMAAPIVVGVVIVFEIAGFVIKKNDVEDRVDGLVRKIEEIERKLYGLKVVLEKKRIEIRRLKREHRRKN